ncbi:MAG: PspC domain-containing protein [Rikenellaceae bacterium]
MKDVKQCSISSVAFTLEVDAYDRLSSYLESIRERYTDDPDGEEILADIEARIAELILSVHSAERVVAKPLIDNIIGQMGNVEDICDGEGGAQREKSESTTQEEPQRSKVKRRLYRDVDDVAIGGVCSGVAAYIGCDPIIVRLIALLLLIFGGSSFWVYIVLWIVIQPAATARQKLEMRGEPVTAASIKEFYNRVANSNNTRSVASSIMATIGRVMMILFKIFMVCILISLILAFVCVAVGLFSIITNSTVLGIQGVGVSVRALTSIAMILTLGIYTSIQLLNSRQVKWKAIIVMLVIWLMLTITTAVMVAINHKSIGERIEDLRELRFDQSEIEEILDEFDIEYESSSSDKRQGDKMEQLHRLEIIYSRSVEGLQEEESISEPQQ